VNTSTCIVDGVILGAAAELQARSDDALSADEIGMASSDIPTPAS